MNQHIEKLLNEFDENEATLNKMRDFVLDFLKEKICVEKGILLAGLEGRVKSRKSLEGKLELKGHKYKEIFDITDLFGARVITVYSDEVDIIASIIEKYFNIDYENSIDKRKTYDVDQFGYLSLHYICTIPEKLYKDDACPNLNTIRFEIQMRTGLQHIWATVFHDTGYKSDVEVPKEYIRRLTRLASLLEIADNQFVGIRDEINDYRKKIRTLVSKGEFNNISFNIDSYKDYLALKPYKTLIDKIANITGAEVEDVSNIRFYDVMVKLGVKDLSEVEQMRIENSDDAYKLSLAQLGGTDIDIIASSIALQNILIIYVMKQGGVKKQIKERLSLVLDNKNISDSYVDKIIEQTKAIIMI